MGPSVSFVLVPLGAVPFLLFLFFFRIEYSCNVIFKKKPVIKKTFFLLTKRLDPFQL